jgi:hypothetical protein
MSYFLSSHVSGTDLTTYTFSSVGLGAEHEARYILVIGFGEFLSGTPSVSSLTIAGETATLLHNEASKIAGFAAVALVPTGSSGDIAVTFSAGARRCGIGVYRLVGLSGLEAFDADYVRTNSSPETATIDIPAGGAAIAAGFKNQGLATKDQEADFEEGDLSDFDSEADANNALTASMAAALAGSWGAQANLATANGSAASGSLTGPAAETELTFEMLFDPNGVTGAGTLRELVIAQFNGASGDRARLIFRISADNTYIIRSDAKLDGGTRTNTSLFNLTDAVHTIRMVWKASSGADDGFLYLYLDDVLLEALTGLDNDTLAVDTVLAGALGAPATDLTGTFYFDDVWWADQIAHPLWQGVEEQYHEAVETFNSTGGDADYPSGATAQDIIMGGGPFSGSALLAISLAFAETGSRHWWAKAGLGR